MKKVASLASYVGVALFVAIGVTQCIEVSKPMPDNAIVLADDEQKLYHSPMHFRDDKVEPPTNLKVTTASEARSKEYKGDSVCRNREYFSYERGSLLKATLSDWTGLAAQPRWNEDGSWNW
jgi:hypothetical protein